MVRMSRRSWSEIFLKMDVRSGYSFPADDQDDQ